MALVLNDRVRETTSVVGTGAVTLLGAVTGFQSFSTIGDANTTYYCISDQAGTGWEVGIGTYVSATHALARTTVLASSNAGNRVGFSAGTKDVFVTYPSSKSVYKDASGNVGINTDSPAVKLDVNSTNSTNRIRIGNFTDSPLYTVPIIESFGARPDQNSRFYGRFGASKRRSDGTAIASGNILGAYAFGAQWGTDTTYNSTNLLYSASITGVSESSFDSATTMSTALVFNTGSSGGSYSATSGVYAGIERMRIDSDGIALIGTSAASGTNKLQVSTDALINALTVGRGGGAITTNTALGYQALYSNTTGNYNTVSGYQALYPNTTGNNNTVSGYQALRFNTTGNNNTVSGYHALRFNTTGDYNTASGSLALYSNTTGNNNTVSGRNALYDLKTTTIAATALVNGTAYQIVTMGTTTAAQWIASGAVTGTVGEIFTANAVAGVGTGTVATSANVATQCLSNTAVGYNTGRGITTGSGNTIIGANVTGLAAGLTNTIILAAGTGVVRQIIDSSGNVGIGLTSPTGKLDVAGTIKTLGYTVATLPTGVVGARAYVTDASTPVFGATVVTGGAVTIPVFYNGTNWIVG